VANSQHTQLYQGLRVGSVELVAEVEPRDSIKGSRHFRQWDVLCDCGGHAFRTEYQLAYALKHNQDTCCEQCLQELRRGTQLQYIERAIKSTKYRASFFARLLNKSGSMYSHDLSKGDHEESPPEVIQVDTFSLDYQNYDTEFNWVNPDYPQQDQWLTPLRSTAGWVCYYCERPFTRGFGCVRCLIRLCDSCKNSGSHCCPRNWMDTWKGEVKDNGLLARRIQLLKLNPLRLTTRQDIEDARRFYRESYIQFRHEQQQAIAREQLEYAKQLKEEALERQRADNLRRAQLRANAKARADAEKAVKRRARDELLRRIARDRAQKRAEGALKGNPKPKVRNRYLKYNRTQEVAQTYV
jgi:hypothetical protein